MAESAYMLKLTWNYKNDEFKTRTVIGDVLTIWELWWQLTRNYTCDNGTAIGSVIVTNLESNKPIPMDKMSYTDVMCGESTALSKN